MRAIYTWFAALTLIAIVGGAVCAGPFSRRSSAGPSGCTIAPPTLIENEVIRMGATSPIATGQSQESRPEAAPVPQPWLLNSEEENTSSQPPDTALEALPGTGSRLGIGPLAPGKISHQIDEASLLKLREILKESLASKNQPVVIAPPVTEETSQRLSLFLSSLQWLLWLGGGYFGISKVGTLLPWVARVVAGLPSAISAAAQQPAPTAAATSSPQVSPSPAGSPAAPSSTGQPVT